MKVRKISLCLPKNQAQKSKHKSKKSISSSTKNTVQSSLKSKYYHRLFLNL